MSKSQATNKLNKSSLKLKKASKERDESPEVASGGKQKKNESLGRRRRYIAEFVGKDFEDWEGKAKDSGLLGGVVEELFYPKDRKKRTVYLRLGHQEQGAVQEYEPELLKNVRKWSQEDGGSKKMARLILKKPWKDLYYYREYTNLEKTRSKKDKRAYLKNKKNEESGSDEDDEEGDKVITLKESSTSSFEKIEGETLDKNPKKKIPLFSYHDLNHTLAKGMPFEKLRKLVLTGDSATVDEFKAKKTDLQDTAQEFPGLDEGEEAPLELLHEPDRLPAPAPAPKRRETVELSELAKELDVQKQADGTDKKLKSDMISDQHSEATLPLLAAPSEREQDGKETKPELNIIIKGSAQSEKQQGASLDS